MIKNQKQVSITKEKLEELQAAFEELKKHEKDYAPVEFELAVESFTVLIADLSKQLNEYNELKDGNFCYTPNSIQDIPQQLIAARLALGLSQKELGDELGLKEQQIQRYEATDYETASWVRMAEVAGVLGVNFRFKPTQLNRLNCNKTYNFMKPIGATEELINVAVTKIDTTNLMPVNA